MITNQTVADQIAAYLHREISAAGLVDWAERALLDEEFAPSQAETIARVVARIGVSDVRTFGLTWDDCEELLHALGFASRVEVVAA